MNIGFKNCGRIDNIMKADIDKLISEVREIPNVMAIVLFGSYANGKTKPLSDIDVAVISKNSNKKTEADISGFSSNVLDVVNFHKLPLYVQFDVLKHGKLIFVKNDKYFLRIKQRVLHDYLEMSYLYERMSKRILT